MDFGAYGRLLQDPRIRHLLAVGFIARFPHTAAGVILTLHVALTLGLGYGQAGLAGAAMTLGIAVGSPWRGRVVDAKGLRRALLPSVIAEAVIWPIVPWLPFWPMLLAVFLGGVFSLPIFSVVRQGLGVLTHGKDRQTAFALDSIVTETIFMMGPALGAVVAATWSSALGLTIVGLSSALGGILLMWFNPPTRSSQLAVVGPATEDPYTEEQDRQEAIAQAVTAAPMHVEMAAPSLATGALPAITEAIPLVTGSLPVIAVGSPWRGRVVDAKGLRRALLPSVIAEAVIWPIVPWLPFWPMLLAVFLGGVFSLPIFSVVRQGLGVLTHGKDRQTAFALDSIVTETIFMMGPALGAVVAATWSSALGLTIVGLSSALGGILLMWFNPPTRSSQLAVVGPATEDPYTEEQDRQEAIAQAVTAAPMHVEMAAPSLATGALPAITEAIPLVTGSLPVIAADGSGPTTAPRRARAERLRQWRRSHFSWVGSEVLGVLVVSMAAGIVMVGTEVSMVAELESQGAAASVGLVYAFWCGASAVGGLFYGAWGRQVHPYLLMALFAVATVPLALVDGVWALALASIPSGLLTAPTLASASSRLSHLVVEERRGEAMGFYGSAMTAGAAMGAPLAGVFIDGVAPSAGYVFAAAAGFVLVLLAALATVARGRRSA